MVKDEVIQSVKPRFYIGSAIDRLSKQVFGSQMELASKGFTVVAELPSGRLFGAQLEVSAQERVWIEIIPSRQ